MTDKTATKYVTKQQGNLLSRIENKLVRIKKLKAQNSEDKSFFLCMAVLA